MKPTDHDAKYIVYYHVHRDSGMGYVGQSLMTMEKRWVHHVCAARSGKGRKGSLGSAIREYGANAFDNFVLEENIEADKVNEAERRWIIEMGTLEPHGFNLCEGGSGTCGFRMTEEEKARVSENSKILWKNPEHRAAMASLAKERMNRPGEREKVSAFLREYKSRPEIRAMVSEQMLSLWKNPEYREARCIAIKESHNRPEVKARKSELSKEFANRPEERVRASLHFRNVWADPLRRAIRSIQSSDMWKDPEHRSLRSNQLKVAGPKSGQYKGVHKAYAHKWECSMKNGDLRFRSRHKSAEQAARAYDELARTHQGKGCYLNFPTPEEREAWLALKDSLSKRKQSR